MFKSVLTVSFYTLISRILGFIRDIFIGYLIGIKKVSYAMRIIISINLLNIVLDYLFVFVFSMTIEGVAYASLIAESSIYVYVTYFLIKNNEFLNKTVFIESYIIESVDFFPT